VIQIQHHRTRETTGVQAAGPELGFRPGSEVPRYPVAYVMNDGGMGDFVNYAAATRWVAEQCPWIDGQLFVNNYLVPLMRDLHEEFTHWKVWPSEKIQDHLKDGVSLVGPSLRVDGRSVNPQLLTVLHAHPIDVAFGYFAGSTPAPEGVEMPRLNYERNKLLPKIKQLKGPYAVFTTGATTQSRTVLGRHLNPVIDYARSLGITPVFIGKTNFVGNGQNSVSFPGDIDYSVGLDMRNQTSVKDAACIMQHAAFTAGLDNGNLHLAALMQDSRVIFGYNITTVEHRAPRRTHGRTINLSVSKQELPCTGCQSRWHQFHTHQFDKCFYKDVKCVDLLFETSKWTNAIDEILKGE
jgi:hypothetical protein